MHHLLVRKFLDYLRLSSVNQVAMSALAFIVGLTSATPSVDKASRVKGYGVEVTTSNEHDPCFETDELIDYLWNRTASSFLVQAPAP